MTIAEHVETKETVDILRKIGVDCIQGYYIGKPSVKLL
jgi:EAL domain-containing protein (putative c-di-GMP-specific phosphodiesterase class I)